MATGYIPLPAAKFPTNAVLDFDPLNKGIDSARNWSQQQHNAMLADKQDSRADEDQGMQRTTFGNQQEDRTKIQFGRRAEAIDQMTDPVQRKNALDQLLSRHPNAAGLDDIYRDPMHGPKAIMADAGLLDTQGKDLPSNVKEWNYFQKLSQPDQEKYLTMKRAEKFYNAGTQFVAPSQVNPAGPPRASIPIDVVGEAAAKQEGEARGKAVAGWPLAERSADRMLETIDRIDQDPNLGNVTGLVGGRIPEQIQTEGMAESQSNINQIGGQTFLQAYNDLRGAGQISEAEGMGAKAAYNRLMTQTMGTPAYRKALGEFRNEIIQLKEIARQKALARSGKNLDGPLPDSAVPQSIPNIRQTQIPPDAVRLLQSRPVPQIIQQFEAKYGPGSAQQYLQAR